MSDAQGTAYLVAHIRAEEAALPEAQRLFDDPYAALFQPGRQEREGVERFLAFEFIREHVRLRTRRIDDVVHSAIRGGITQVVLLGAGFDCRALRLPEFASGSVRVFEVDFAAQLERKRAQLAEGRVVIPAFVQYVGFDFAEDALEAKLTSALCDAGFRTSDRAVFVWEGVAPYLTDAAVDRSLAFMARAGGAGSQVVLDYHVLRVARDDLARRLREAGFARVEDVGMDALYREHIGSEPPEVAASFRVAWGES